MKTIVWIQNEDRSEKDYLAQDGVLISPDDLNRTRIVKRLIDIHNSGTKIPNREHTFSLSKAGSNYAIKLPTNKRDEFNRHLPAIVLLEDVTQSFSVVDIRIMLQNSLKVVGVEIESHRVEEIAKLIQEDVSKPKKHIWADAKRVLIIVVLLTITLLLVFGCLMLLRSIL